MLDAYELLGLAPGVTETEVKRAFRRLAMRWHPDRNPDPAAGERFKALRQAYETLLAAVDGPAAAESATSEPAAGAGEAPADDVARGADRRLDLELSIEEAVLGGEKPVCLPTETVCEQCAGTGEQSLSVSRLCEPCRGSGRLRDGGKLVRCGACHGRGYRSTHTCPACDGNGRQTRQRWLHVGLPPGLVDDDELRLAGEGEPAPAADGRAGDLRLRIRLAPHPLFRRSGRDLVLQRPLSALRMLLGGELRVPHPAGMRTLALEPGPARPHSLRVAGAGFPARGGHPAGDLVVDLLPTLPQSADAELRPLIEALEAGLARTASRHLPEVAQWEARWLD